MGTLTAEEAFGKAEDYAVNQASWVHPAAAYFQTCAEAIMLSDPERLTPKQIAELPSDARATYEAAPDLDRISAQRD